MGYYVKGPTFGKVGMLIANYGAVPDKVPGLIDSGKGVVCTNVRII